MGRHLIFYGKTSSEFFGLFGRAIVGTFSPPIRWKDISKQIQFVAWESAPIVLFCLCFAAIVTIIEEEIAWPVLGRLGKQHGWQMADPETGRTFGGG